VGPPVDWEFFEAHLPVLLRLLAACRAGRLPGRWVARRLVDLIYQRGGELSIEVVYRHADLFRVLLGTQRPEQRRDGRSV